MSIPPIPGMTVCVAKRAFRKGNIYLSLGDEFGTIVENVDFVELYAKEGKPALLPAMLALVLIFQFVEGLSDRKAAAAVRVRIDWQYALHLPLEDEGTPAELAELRRFNYYAGCGSSSSKRRKEAYVCGQRRRSLRIKSLLTMRNFSPNLSRICSRYWICNAAGQTMSAVRALWRMMSSCSTRPTSSAMSRFTLDICKARSRGSS